ncbi:hypothetical protein LJE71_09365 [Xanthobacter autotrophicus]|uniref:hypothetical protein n=1 Tax=Xanthobacter autotrophicus TaxID=280 RepID=UPI001E6585C7|nr:hypothetical protein [Xanthobacter autotrophicus]UDQ91175.1 hypothetical protein LJE71_09365 [Xanthobacter autotrophicus]
MHSVNPDAVTFESEGCRHLISQYVDDHSHDFFFMTSAKRLKDFSRTHMVGVVGAGLAYLQMVRDGYVWCDHFENLPLSGLAPSRKSPDFVFNRPGENDVALTESKATHGTARKAFQATVTRGYRDQVSPYFGMKVGGSLASHGFSIGSWMTSATRAELLIDHTAVTTTQNPPRDPGDPIAIRRGNYLTALSLMFGPSIVSAARAGTWLSSDTGLLTTTWLGRRWLLGFPPPYLGFRFWAGEYRELSKNIDWTAWPLVNEFALELHVAESVFRSLSNLDSGYEPLSEIEVMNEDLMARAREAGGAVFPDGLAVLGKQELIEPVKISYWDPQAGEIKEHFYSALQERIEDPLFSVTEAGPSWFIEEEVEEKEKVEPAMLLLTKK